MIKQKFTSLTKEEHKQRHIELHKYLDELLADFIKHTGKLLDETNLTTFLDWSYQQTQNPTEYLGKGNETWKTEIIKLA